MTDRRSLALLYAVPVAACALTAVGLRGFWGHFSDYWLSVITMYSLWPMSVTAGVLTALRLRQVAKRGESGGSRRWLPAFVALTTLKALALWVLCVTLGSEAKYPDEGPTAFVLLYMVLPTVFTLCTVSSVFVFAVASLVARLLPKPQEGAVSAARQVKATGVANAAVLAVGLALAYWSYLRG